MSISIAMLVHSRKLRGEFPKDFWENQHLSQPFHKNSPPPTRRSLGGFLSSCEKATMSVCEATQRLKLKHRWRTSWLFPLERARNLRRPRAWRLHSREISSSIQMIKDATDEPTKTSHMQQIISVFLRGLAGRHRDRAQPERRCTTAVETLSTTVYLTPSAAKN